MAPPRRCRLPRTFSQSYQASYALTRMCLLSLHGHSVFLREPHLRSSIYYSLIQSPLRLILPHDLKSLLALTMPLCNTFIYLM